MARDALSLTVGFAAVRKTGVWRVFCTDRNPMTGSVRIVFRGIEPREELVVSSKAWSANIRDGVPASCSVDADVLIDRRAPQWPAGTTVRVSVTIDGWEIAEFARAPDPHDALEKSFAAIEKRLGPGFLFTDPARNASPAPT